MANPEQQGLKLLNPMFPHVFWERVEMANPEQQGLKPERACTSRQD